MGIRETLRQVHTKRVMRAAWDQKKTACRNPQQCAGLGAGIEGATHAVGQRRLARVGERQEDTEEVEVAEEEEDESGEIAEGLRQGYIL